MIARRFLCSLLSIAPWLCSDAAHGQFSLHPDVNPNDFRITTFASELNYPVGMAELADGSMMVAVSNGSSFFGSSSGQILRLADNDGDGVADEQQVLVNSVPGGGLSALRVAGNLVFTTGQGRGKPISIYRLGENPADPLTSVGQLTVNYPAGGWLHPHSALAARPTQGAEDSVDLFFQLGSKVNFATTTATASLTSDIGVSGSLAGDAIHMVTLVDDGQSVRGGNLTQIATGLRNAAGMAFHPTTGDMYLQDNGIDGLQNANEPHSADELNVIAAGNIGGQIDDFGFPDRYNEYRTGNLIGVGGVDPIVAFHPLPLPNGDEGEGPNDIAFSPPGFPVGLNDGVFVGMHGKFSLGGTANEENPLVFVDLRDNSYFHFIQNDEPNVGHLDGLLSNEDSLFVADISPHGGFGSNAGSTGKIYQIQAIRDIPLPCDFNRDGGCGVDDLNQLMYDGLVNQQSIYDLDGNQTVDLGDRDVWLSDAGLENIGRAYLTGDTNLDGVVEAADLNDVGISWLQPGIDSWASGDFNGDGTSDAVDLNEVGLNWQTGVAAAVPEPTKTVNLWFFLLAVPLIGRRGDHAANRSA